MCVLAAKPLSPEHPPIFPASQFPCRPAGETTADAASVFLLVPPLPSCAAVSLCCDWTRATRGGRSSIGFFRQHGGNSIRKDEGMEGGRWYGRAKNTAQPAKSDVMQQQEESWRGGGANVVERGVGKGALSNWVH